MKRVVFFLSLLIVVFCSSCEKEEIPLEQKIVGEWNLDLSGITILRDGVVISSTDMRPFIKTALDFQSDKIFSLRDLDNGSIIQDNEWEVIGNNKINFKYKFDTWIRGGYQYKVEEITNTRCVLSSFEEETLESYNPNDGSKVTYVETRKTRVVLSREK